MLTLRTASDSRSSAAASPLVRPSPLRAALSSSAEGRKSPSSRNPLLPGSTTASTGSTPNRPRSAAVPAALPRLLQRPRPGLEHHYGGPARGRRVHDVSPPAARLRDGRGLPWGKTCVNVGVPSSSLLTGQRSSLSTWASN
ncbi:hypothetical protein L227DRAFT_313375 [Lentinus tigrinus ALCF2SS1-6]|uniref:Uncharacterized protein n=1 Tax=Lentinus tigrinus ALCF2SS1-6 TaxID=1328759 RepID=A0A5C2RW84_9APHY|nr:hypothetical protein L227DRAFT_313375 [Lentinus tigrinus ALCF2SS1-6]